MGSNLWKQGICNGLLQPPPSLPGNERFVFQFHVKPFQIWASSFLPNEAMVKDKNMQEYKVWWQICYNTFPLLALKASRGSNLLLDYAQQEVAKKERIIVENSDWLGLVPYWATWPYETMILPRSRHILRWHGIQIIRNYVLFEGWLTWQRLKDWVWRISWSSWRPNTTTSSSAISHTLW